MPVGDHPGATSAKTPPHNSETCKLADDFMTEEGMTGSAGFASQDAALVETAAAAHNQMMDHGVDARLLVQQEAVANNCTPMDRRWLCNQLHINMRNQPLNIWSPPGVVKP